MIPFHGLHLMYVEQILARSAEALLEHRDQDEESAECAIGDVGEDVIEVREAEHKVAAERVVETSVVVDISPSARPRFQVCQHQLQSTDSIRISQPAYPIENAEFPS